MCPNSFHSHCLTRVLSQKLHQTSGGRFVNSDNNTIKGVSGDSKPAVVGSPSGHHKGPSQHKASPGVSSRPLVAAAASSPAHAAAAAAAAPSRDRIILHSNVDGTPAPSVADPEASPSPPNALFVRSVGAPPADNAVPGAVEPN